MRPLGLTASLALAAALAIGAIAAAEITGADLFGIDDVTPRLEAEAQDRKSVRPCDITIAQFGPSERWLRHAHVYGCATAAREVPSHILSAPVEQ